MSLWHGFFSIKKSESKNRFFVGDENMSEHGHEHNGFPHDGEGNRPCTGYGCDCDERNYGSPSWNSPSRKYKTSSGSAGTIFVIIIVALAIGFAISEVLGVFILLALLVYMIFR